VTAFVATNQTILVVGGGISGITAALEAAECGKDVVLVENPTYTGAIQVFQSYGAMTVGVPVDDEGIVTSILEDAARRASGGL
jgi:DNA-binding transcriptional MocR family regulator